MVSVGITVSGHFCGGDLRSLSLFAKAEPCEHQNGATPPCHHAAMMDQDTDQPEQRDCCGDKTAHVQTFTEEAPVPTHNITRLFAPLLSMMKAAWRLPLAQAPQKTKKQEVVHQFTVKEDIPILVQSLRI